jgi:predicted Zn-dependent protease
MPRLDDQFKAYCKLELGDIYLLKGEEWDAMLLYGQVDKDFKEDPLGQEAKFRNAKLSYYIGEFEWARAQLDVLKTATTQLIANNAMELSLLIQDNTLDSIEEPLLLFAKADLLYYQNKTSDALLLLDSIDAEYPRHSLADDILMKRAEISYKNRDYAQSVKYLNLLLKEHGSDILGDNALFMLADITEYKLNDKEGAKKLYEDFLAAYPGSFFTAEVRKRFRALRGDVMNQEQKTPN